MSSRWPCIDEYHRYRSFPCHLCKALDCWMGKKPSPRKAVLHSGQRYCGHCETPFHSTGRNRYCSDSCRYQAMMKRRRARKAA